MYGCPSFDAGPLPGRYFNDRSWPDVAGRSVEQSVIARVQSAGEVNAPHPAAAAGSGFGSGGGRCSQTDRHAPHINRL